MALKRLTKNDSKYVKLGKEGNPVLEEGYYVGSESKPDANGRTSTSHTLQKTNGQRVTLWGGADLDSNMPRIKRGTYTKVTFIGMKPTKNGKMYNHDIDTDDENTIEVEALGGNNFADGYTNAGSNTTYENAGGYTDDEDEQVVVPRTRSSAAARANVSSVLGKKK